jgi:hypothetical protein
MKYRVRGKSGRRRSNYRKKSKRTARIKGAKISRGGIRL